MCQGRVQIQAQVPVLRACFQPASACRPGMQARRAGTLPTCCLVPGWHPCSAVCPRCRALQPRSCPRERVCTRRPEVPLSWLHLRLVAVWGSPERLRRHLHLLRWALQALTPVFTLLLQCLGTAAAGCRMPASTCLCSRAASGCCCRLAGLPAASQQAGAIQLRTVALHTEQLVYGSRAAAAGRPLVGLPLGACKSRAAAAQLAREHGRTPITAAASHCGSCLARQGEPKLVLSARERGLAVREAADRGSQQVGPHSAVTVCHALSQQCW